MWKKGTIRKEKGESDRKIAKRKEKGESDRRKQKG